jgi:hypothetical protein
MNALTVIEQSTTLSSDLAASSRLAADFIKASRAPNTLDAYVSDFRIFDAWCSERALVSLPPTPDTLCMFLADEASRGRRPSTLQRRLAAIKYAVEAAGVLADTEKSPTSHKAVTALWDPEDAGSRAEAEAGDDQRHRPCGDRLHQGR